MRAAPSLAATLLLGCAAGCGGNDNARLVEDGGALDFVIGGSAFHVASGGTRSIAGVLNLFLTDQPDTCLSTSQVPRGRAAVLTLRVAPRNDGGNAAQVVAVKAIPGAGEAVGGLTFQVGGAVESSYDAEGGSVSWAGAANGGTEISALDVGFKGASGRVALGGWTIPACP